jgi:hydroxymethylbilane synthase
VIGTRPLIIGSRGSALALWQARHIAGRLLELGQETRIEIIKTTGDRMQEVSLVLEGGKGLFTKEIEEALLAGSIDVAVHSMKDVPTEIPAGLTIAAIPERENPLDALVGCSLAELKQGSRVGTSSPRRASQLHALNRGLVIETLRGNVDTRLRKLDQGQHDAIVLAAAGLRRLGWEDRIRELIPPEIMCPAAGQGALAIQTREDGDAAWHVVKKLDDAAARAAVEAERSLLLALGGGCQVPIGAHAQVVVGTIHLIAMVASPDGSRLIRGESTGAEASTVGAELGERLLTQGAREILSPVNA